MFSRESDMTPSVTRWLTSVGLQVRPEFVTPWGICDLVGLSFNPDKVAHRLRLKQQNPVTSITRAALLLQVPEVESFSSISLQQLVTVFKSVVAEDVVVTELERLISDKFVVRTAHGELQKLNGWMPLQERLVAVELKLSRVEEALQQAKRNLGFVQESFVAFPMPVAQRIANSRCTWNEHFAEGIGLIGVQKRRCEIVIPAALSPRWTNPAIQLYCVEKFWRFRCRD